MWGVILMLSLIGLLFYAVMYAVQFPADERTKNSSPAQMQQRIYQSPITSGTASTSNSAPAKKATSSSVSDTQFRLMQFQNNLRILQDCLNIMDNTVDFSVFHERCELAAEKISILNRDMLNLPVDSSISNHLFAISSKFDSIVSQAKSGFIQRSYSRLLKDTSNLKTNEGKTKRVRRYLTKLDEFSWFLSDADDYSRTKIAAKQFLYDLGDDFSSNDDFSSSEEKRSAPRSSFVDPEDDPFYDDISGPLAVCDRLGIDPATPFEEVKSHLEQFSMQRAARFAARHEKQVGKINLEALSKVLPRGPEPLSASETLFLDYINGYRYGNNIGGYWTHEYHIDYQTVLEKYFAYGYMRFADAKVSLQKYTIADFKAFLSAHDMSTGGKKQDLIDRIIKSFDEDTIYSAFPRKVFALTKAGFAVVHDDDYLIYFQNNMTRFSIPIEMVETEHMLHPELGKYELALSILESRADANLQNKDYGLYRCDLYAQSIVHHDAEHYPTELVLLLQVCFIDYYGYGNGGIQSKTDALLAPGILSLIALNKVYTALDDAEREDFYVRSVRKLPSCFAERFDPRKSFVKVAESVAAYMQEEAVDADLQNR